jgi:hypothetical protein
MKKKIILAAATALSVFVSNPALATTAITSFSGGTTFSGFSSDETVGFKFLTANNISVSQLGWFATSGTLNASHQVGIWSLAGTLLGSTVVTAGAADGTGFRYANVGAIVLAAGQQYFIGGRDLTTDGDNYRTSVSNLVTASGITFQGSAVSGVGAGFSFPGVTVNSGNTGGRFGPNFIFSAVPEPATWMMMIFGFGLAGAAMRSRRRTVQVSFS